MRRLAGALLLLLLVSPAMAGSLPSKYTVQSHSYLWRADGNSATQGSGSIFNWPTVTNSTASCTLSQVTTSPTGVMPPGSGTLIKGVCTGGVSGGTPLLIIGTPSNATGALGNFGFYWYQADGGTSAITQLQFDLSEDNSFAKRFVYFATTGTQRRIDGWNLIAYQNGDENTTVGGMTYGTASTYVAFRVTLAAGSSITFYLSDLISGFYAKPQVTVWSADNVASGYSAVFAYLNAAGRKLPGSYCPTTGTFPAGITNAQMTEMVTAGWDVQGHNTAGQSYTSITLAEMDIDVKANLAYIRAQGWQLSPVWCYQGGNRNASTDAVLAANGIAYSIGGNVGNEAMSRPIYGGILNPYNLWVYNADAAASAATTMAVIDHAVKYGGQISLIYHDVPSTCDTTCFQTTINYLVRLRDANIIDVTTYSGLIRRQTVPRWNRLPDKVN